MEQVKQVKERIKGKVYRYRAFVRPDADVGQLSVFLRAPVLSIIRVAGLPDPGHKILLEAVTNGGRNPQGLVFISGQGVSKNEQVTKVLPMVTETFGNVDKALKGAALEPADVLSMTCYLNSLEDLPAVKALASERYPTAAISHLQIPIPYGKALVECEAIARAKSPIGFVYPEGLTKSPNFTQVVGISTRSTYWSGIFTAYNGCTDQSVKAMFQRLDASMKKSGASIQNVAFSYVYPTNQQGTDLTRAVRFDFYSKTQAPASTLVPFSGFEDRSACTGLEVAAPVN